MRRLQEFLDTQHSLGESGKDTYINAIKSLIQLAFKFLMTFSSNQLTLAPNKFGGFSVFNHGFSVPQYIF
jgi:hypothetical protein